MNDDRFDWTDDGEFEIKAAPGESDPPKHAEMKRAYKRKTKTPTEGT